MAVTRGRPAAWYSQLAALTALATLLVASCSSTDHSSDPRRTHQEGTGALSIRLLDGGQSLEPPGVIPWEATFGSALPCSTTGKKVTIEAVSYDEPVSPLEIKTLVRDVPAAVDRASGEDGMPIGARIGPPTNFASTPHKAAGSLSAKVKGLVVGTCPAKHRDPNKRFIEFLTVMKVGSRGAWVKGINVNYRVDGKRFKLHSNWTYIACGSKIAGTEYCPAGDNDR